MVRFRAQAINAPGRDSVSYWFQRDERKLNGQMEVEAYSARSQTSAIERLVKRPRFESVEAMSWRAALGVGLIQCLSMIPGVSRSGATIIGALSLGVERKTAAEYSFFLAVPTMLAASSYDLLRSGSELGEGAWGTIAVGFVVSFIVALVVIKWFIAIVSKIGFAPFAWYRIIIGTAAMIWLSLR